MPAQEQYIDSETFKKKYTESESIKIISPLPGTVFAPGDTINVELSYDGPLDGSILLVTGPGCSPQSEQLTSKPYEFSCTVDQDCVGELGIMATFFSNKLYNREEAEKAIPIPQTEINVSVVPKAELLGLKHINYGPFFLDVGDELQLTLEGVYADGITRYLEDRGLSISYISSDSSVATVDQKGKIKAVSPGECEIYFKYGGASGKITTKVAGKPEMVRRQFPVDGEINVPPSVKLIWGGRVKQYELYLWKASEIKPATPIEINYGHSYKPVGGLESHTTYYWQVVAKNPAGKTEGPVFEFTTSGNKQ